MSMCLVDVWEVAGIPVLEHNSLYISGKEEDAMKRRHRPIFHLLPEDNWMNDPNGPIYIDGLYHLFYQHNPDEAKWGNIHWGHAVSKDLIRWSHRPIALFPSKEEGELHCFSGCIVIRDDGTPMIFYTSVGEGDRNAQSGAEQWAAVGSMDLNDWVKVHENPVIEQSIHDETLILEWRDPCVFRHGDDWMMVLGGSHQGHGCATLYRALDPDLYTWEYLGILSQDTHGSDMWECPSFFPYRGRYILIYSPNSSMRYEIGDFDGHTFTCETVGILDYGGWQGLYAGITCEDGEGRRILFGWMPEVLRISIEHEGYAWAGVQSIPRVMEIDDQGKLTIDPVETLNLLHDAEAGLVLADELMTGTWVLPVRGKALDISCTIAVPEEGEFGFELLRHETQREKTRIIFQSERQNVRIDREQSSVLEMPYATPVAAPWEARDDGQVSVRILLDHSTLEVFVDSRITLSTRAYPHFDSSEEVALFTDSPQGLRVVHLEVYPVHPARED